MFHAVNRADNGRPKKAKRDETCRDLVVIKTRRMQNIVRPEIPASSSTFWPDHTTTCPLTSRLRVFRLGKNTRHVRERDGRRCRGCRADRRVAGDQGGLEPSPRSGGQDRVRGASRASVNKFEWRTKPPTRPMEAARREIRPPKEAGVLRSG